MRIRNFSVLLASYCLAVVVPAMAAPSGVDSATLIEEIRALRASVAELKKIVQVQGVKLSDLERRNATEAPASSPVFSQAQSLPTPQTLPTASKPGGTYVPEIGVVMDVVGTSSQSQTDEDGNDRVSLRELEFVFGHDIDPYSRMDVVATFSDQEDPDIEEATVTYWGLPWGIKARVGRMRERIGKASSTHRDSLDTVDEPLVVQRYLGLEGLFRSGLEVSAFTPLSLEDYTQELVMGIMEGGIGEEGQLFGETRRAPSFYGHLANFLSISDDASFELGGSYLLGSQDEDPTPEVSAFGVDATMSYFVTPRNKLKLQSEFYFQRRPGVLETPTEVLAADQNPYGFYALADYRFGERWGGGLRYDYVQPTLLHEGDRSTERGAAAYLTFFQSEFARWRFQYERLNLEDGKDDNQFFLQGTFAIGTHKHQLN